MLSGRGRHSKLQYTIYWGRLIKFSEIMELSQTLLGSMQAAQVVQQVLRLADSDVILDAWASADAPEADLQAAVSQVLCSSETSLQITTKKVLEAHCYNFDKESHLRREFNSILQLWILILGEHDIREKDLHTR